MGPKPKRPETIGIDVEPSGALSLREPSWASATVRTDIIGLLGLGAGGIWTNVAKTGAVDDKLAAWTETRTLVAEAQASAEAERMQMILNRLNQMEAATGVRLTHIEAAHSALALDVAVTARTVERLERRAERAERGMTRTR